MFEEEENQAFMKCLKLSDRKKVVEEHFGNYAHLPRMESWQTDVKTCKKITSFPNTIIVKKMAQLNKNIATQYDSFMETNTVIQYKVNTADSAFIFLIIL